MQLDYQVHLGARRGIDCEIGASNFPIFGTSKRSQARVEATVVVVLGTRLCTRYAGDAIAVRRCFRFTFYSCRARLSVGCVCTVFKNLQSAPVAKRELCIHLKQVHATYGRPTMIRFDGSSCLPYVTLVVLVPARHVGRSSPHTVPAQIRGERPHKLRTRISRERGRDGPILYIRLVL